MTLFTLASSPQVELYEALFRLLCVDDSGGLPLAAHVEAQRRPASRPTRPATAAVGHDTATAHAVADAACAAAAGGAGSASAASASSPTAVVWAGGGGSLGSGGGGGELAGLGGLIGSGGDLSVGSLLGPTVSARDAR